jgi:hypothetical protein
MLAHLVFAGCTPDERSRLVRPTHASFNPDERSEVWERSLQATVAQANERILVVDRENGVITTPSSTIRLSPGGMLTYTTPTLLRSSEAEAAERANYG